VKGRVQGVFFRASTQDKARELNLVGHAYNLVSGDVEVVACGNETKVRQLQEWLWQGPSAALVEDVLCQEVEVDVEGGFVIG
jgi:acylphosphatase